jgi:hypothetical protein
MLSLMQKTTQALARAKSFFHLPVLQEREVGRPHIRMRNPLVAGKLDVRVETIYDWWGVAPGTGLVSQTFFSKRIGEQVTYTGAGAAIGLTIYHTSLQQAGQLVAPEKMLVKAIEVIPRGDIHPYDLNALLFLNQTTFKVQAKEYWQGLPVECPAGGGGYITGGPGPMGGTAPTGTSGYVSSCSNGYPSQQAIQLLIDASPVPSGWDPNVPPPDPINGIFIEQGQPISVEFNPTLTGQTAYTTAVTTGTPTVLGIPTPGLFWWCKLMGDHFVAVQ